MDDRIRRAMRVAYLCAVGDAFLTDEETDVLAQIDAVLRLIFRNEELISAHARTGRFPAEMPETQLVTSYATAGMGGLPVHLFDLHEVRSNMQSMDDLMAMYRAEAAEISHVFDQHVALFAMAFVASADGDFSDGQRFVQNHFAVELWSVQEEYSDMQESILQFLNLAGFDIERLNDWEEAEEVYGAIDVFPEGVTKNSPGVMIACVIACASSDGDIDADERELLGPLARNLVDVAGSELSDEDQRTLEGNVDDAIAAVIGALFTDELESRGNAINVIKTCATYLSDPEIAAITCAVANGFVARTGDGVLERAGCFALQVETGADESAIESYVEFAQSLLEG